MESKKRPHADDAEHSRAKKRAVSDEHASPSHLNGTAASHGDEPGEGDNLELFRKEAIFRRMRYYSREAERSQARVADLERRFSTCQAGLAALEACWTQLIGTIRSLVKPEDLPSLKKESEDIYDLTVHLSSEAEPEYVDALRDKMQSTSDIVKAFVSLSAQSHGSTDEEMLRRCQEAENERSALRSELSFVRTQLRDSEAQKQQYHEQLISAEKRADRLQSTTLSLSKSVTREESVQNDTPSVETGSPAPPALNGITHSADADEWRDLANLRETKIEELTRENSELQNQLQAAQLQLKTLPEDVVTETSYYKGLQERASKLEFTLSECQTEAIKMTEQLDNLHSTRIEFEAGIKSANESALAELKQLLSKRDAEVNRLREQKDQQQAEINERKAKDQVKANAAAEYKALAETRAERISILESENKRLKARLATNAGDEDLVTFLWQSSSENTSYVDDLKRRLSTAEERAAALEKTLASIQGGRGDIARSEAEARQQLAQVQKQLEKYQAVYGDASSMSPDTAQLSKQLQSKQAELDKLHLQDKEREQAESALYNEIDKLSSAWEALDKQVKKKVYDLSAIEDRLAKLNVDKAKTENKYYQLLRDKDTCEAARKKANSNLDKAAKAIEMLTDTEKNLTARVAVLEKELSLWKRMAEEQRDRGNSFEHEAITWRERTASERKAVEEMRAAFIEHTQAIERKRTELRKLEESLLKTKRDAEKHATKLKSLSTNAATGSTKEAELQVELNKMMCLLKCSTCQLNFRNTVITKCMHSFCRQCVDARISTRQRKCPACNLPFSAGEVQPLYFQ